MPILNKSVMEEKSVEALEDKLKDYLNDYAKTAEGRLSQEQLLS